MKFYILENEQAKKNKILLENHLDFETFVLTVLKSDYKDDLLWILKNIDTELQFSILQFPLESSSFHIDEIQKVILSIYNHFNYYSKQDKDIVVHPMVLDGTKQYLINKLLNFHKSKTISYQGIPKQAISKELDSIIINIDHLRQYSNKAKFAKTHLYLLLHILYHSRILNNSILDADGITLVRHAIHDKFPSLSITTMKDHIKKKAKLTKINHHSRRLKKSIEDLIKVKSDKKVRDNVNSVTPRSLDFLNDHLFSLFEIEFQEGLHSIIATSDNGLNIEDLKARLQSTIYTIY